MKKGHPAWRRMAFWKPERSAPRSVQRCQRMRMRRPGAVEEGAPLRVLHVFDARGVPARVVVLVHGQCAYAFDGLALARAQVEAVAHHVALHAQVLGQRQTARKTTRLNTNPARIPDSCST